MAGSAGSIFVDLLLGDANYQRGWQRARRTTDSGVSAITSRLGAVAAAFAASFSTAQILRINDNFTALESRLKLVSTSGVSAAESLDRLYSIAQTNRQPFEEAANGYIRLSQSLTEYQRAQNDVLKISDLLSQTLRISGTDAAGAATFYQQFGQAASSDFKAIGQELQTFADQNPVFYGLIRDEVAKTGETLKKFAADGKLSFDFVAKVLTDNATIINQQANGMAITVGQAGTVLSNAFQNYIRKSPDVDAASQLIARGILDIAAAIDKANTKGYNFTSAVGGFFGGLMELEVSIAEAQLDASKFLNLSDKTIQEQENYIARRKDLIKALKEEVNARNNPSSPPGQNNPGTPPVTVEQLEQGDRLKKQLEDFSGLYQKNLKYIDGLDSSTRDYIASQVELESLLGEGLITFGEYNAAIGRLRVEYDETQKKADESFGEMSEYAKRSAENIQDAFADFLFDPFQDGLDGMLLGFVNTLRKIAAEQASAQILGDGKTGLLSSIIGGIGSLFGGGKNVYGNNPVGPFPAGFDGFRAEGGTVGAGKWAIAGENGAEVVYGGTTGATVFNQDQMRGSGGGNTYIDARGADREGLASLERLIIARTSRQAIMANFADGQRRGNV